MKIRSRLTVAGIAATVLPLALIAGVAIWQASEAEESASASEELASQAEHLREIVSRFVLDDHRATTARASAIELEEHDDKKSLDTIPQMG